MRVRGAGRLRAAMARGRQLRDRVAKKATQEADRMALRVAEGRYRIAGSAR
jgi:hypothetical protein